VLEIKLKKPKIKPTMKPLILITVAIGILLSGSLFAGPPEAYKQVAAPPPPELYGLGFYGAIDGGANVFQDPRHAI
jgi:hypothetical protein